MSHDFDPSTSLDWEENIQWSQDSLVIAVMITEQYVYAYDFYNPKSYEDNQQIMNLLEKH
jgi:hypothetical protein